MSHLRQLKNIESIPYKPAHATEMRLRALNRLYARRDAVDALIRSLEVYESSQRKARGACVSITAERKYS